MIFLHFIWAWVLNTWAKLRGYEAIAPTSVQIDRVVQCLNCPAFNDGECTDCGCLVVGKVMLATEQCPRKKWLRVWKKSVTTITNG